MKIRMMVIMMIMISNLVIISVPVGLRAKLVKVKEVVVRYPNSGIIGRWEIQQMTSQGSDTKSSPPFWSPGLPSQTRP